MIIAGDNALSPKETMQIGKKAKDFLVKFCLRVLLIASEIPTI